MLLFHLVYAMRIRFIWSIARLCIVLIWSSCEENLSRFVNVKDKKSKSELCNVIIIFTVDILFICFSSSSLLDIFLAIALCSNSDTSLQFDTIHHDCAWNSSSEMSVSSVSSSIIQALLSNVSQKKSFETAWDNARDVLSPDIWAIQDNVSQKNFSVTVQDDISCSLNESISNHRRQTTSDLLK